MATKFKQDINVIGTLSATTLSGDGSALTGVGGDITVQEEGSPLATAATTLNFVGAGVTATGTGATKAHYAWYLEFHRQGFLNTLSMLQRFAHLL